MEVRIANNSDGTTARVTPEYQLEVRAETLSQQHYISREFAQTFQVIGVTDTLTSATIPVLHIKNTDSERDLVVTYVRMQIVDPNATLPATDNYFQMGVGSTVTGGTVVVPVNTNVSSGKVASVTATHSTPTSGGTFSEIDRYYPTADGDSVTYNKDGSVILGLNDTFEVRMVSTGTAGIAYARATFMMVDKE